VQATAAIEVGRYRAEDGPAWDDLVRRARVPHFLLLRGYMDYHADRFADNSFVVREDGVVRALLPATRSGDVVVSHGGLTFGGLITDARASIGRVTAWFEAIVVQLVADGVRRLRYKPIPHIYHEVPAEEDLYVLYRLGARLVQRDLSASIAMDRRPPYSKGRKASVKTGRRSLEVSRDHDVRTFWPIEEAWLTARHGLSPVHSADEIDLLASRFPDQIKLYTGRDDTGRVLAGVVVFETPRVAHAQYIAATEAGTQCGAVDAVIDHLLGEVYADKPWFDFGISTVAGTTLNGGLARNKESYGGRGVAYDVYELELDRPGR
jgi:hypothetical protein